MNDTPYYYLHENGTLIYKPSARVDDLQDSPFVRCYWPLFGRDRYWQVVVEALAMGVSRNAVQSVIDSLGGEDDALNYIKFLGATCELDGDKWMVTRGDYVNLQESPAGFGDTPLLALVDLVKKLGFKGRYMWGPTVETLVCVKEVK